MTGDALRRLSRSDLEALAAALRSERIRAPFTAIAIEQNGLADSEAEAVAAELGRLAAEGFTFAQMDRLLRILAEERRASHDVADRVKLVWTGPEAAGARSRDTWVVVRELFETAERSVTVASFSLYGSKIFAPLNDRMRARPAMRVRFLANVGRKLGDERPDAAILTEFADTFNAHVWPWTPRPALYFDGRALSKSPGPRSCLHAKCIVADSGRALVTSANLTEAAQERNIEAGVLLEDEGLASALEAQFEGLIVRGDLLELKE